MQKGSATVLILAAVLIIILAAGGIYYLKKPGSFKQIPIEVEKNVSAASEESPKAVSRNNPLLSNTPRNNPTLYIDSKLGLKFNLLDGLKVVEDSEEDYNKRGNGNFRKNFTGYVGYEPPQFAGAIAVLDKSNSFDNNSFSVWVFENPDNLTTESWFGKFWYYPFLWGVFDYTSKGHVTPDTEATISGLLTKYKIISYQPGSPKYLYLSDNGKMYLFRVIGSIGDQVLSSFKFLK